MVIVTITFFYNVIATVTITFFCNVIGNCNDYILNVIDPSLPNSTINISSTLLIISTIYTQQHISQNEMTTGGYSNYKAATKRRKKFRNDPRLITDWTETYMHCPEEED